MGASDPGTDDSWFGDDTGYEIDKAEKESGMKVAEDSGSGWTKADNPPGIGPLGLATAVATMGTSLPISMLAGKIASFVEEKAGIKNITDASVLGGTTKGRTGTGAPRSMIASSSQKSAPNYNRQFSNTDNKFGDEGEQGDNRQRQTQVSSAPPSPQSTQVAELDELEDQMAQARRGRYGRRTSMLSPGNTGSGYS